MKWLSFFLHLKVTFVLHNLFKGLICSKVLWMFKKIALFTKNGWLGLWSSHFCIVGPSAQPNVAAYFQMLLDTCVQRVQDSKTMLLNLLKAAENSTATKKDHNKP